MGSPFENLLLRYGVGVGGAAVIAFVALFLLEGTARWVALGIAVLDAVVTPMVLKRAAT